MDGPILLDDDFRILRLRGAGHGRDGEAERRNRGKRNTDFTHGQSPKLISPRLNATAKSFVPGNFMNGHSGQEGAANRYLVLRSRLRWKLKL
jgi:hypothetical protein